MLDPLRQRCLRITLAVVCVAVRLLTQTCYFAGELPRALCPMGIRQAAPLYVFKHKQAEEVARENVACDVLAPLELVIAQRLAVGEHDEREMSLWHLEVDRRETGAPVPVMPNQLDPTVIGDEPA